MSVRNDVLAALPPGRWMAARELWEQMGLWSKISVRHELQSLADENVIEADADDNRPLWISARATRYRRRADG